jgi:hypothetical protein
MGVLSTVSVGWFGCIFHALRIQASVDWTQGRFGRFWELFDGADNLFEFAPEASEIN